MQEIPGSNPGAAETEPKVLGSDGIIRIYLPLCVDHVFGMRACSLFRFVLII